MQSDADFEIPRGRSRFLGSGPEVGVHVLSEHIFCPRAAVLALALGEDTGDDEPNLGPRLDAVYDYDEHRFAEALRSGWAELRLWLTLLAPALFLAYVVWRFVSPFAVIVAALPALYSVARICNSLFSIVWLVRERAVFRAAPAAPIDLAPQQIYEVNWWSLRKAGFDCLKPEVLRDLNLRLGGRPWRILTKGTTLRIPVVRRHRGERVWGPQHIVRLAAYCRLIEACEGADSPFGVLMFVGSYECLVFPNTAVAKSNFEEALREVREFLAVHATGKFAPVAPTDNRCSGCHYGKPIEYKDGVTDTVLNGVPLVPLQTKATNGRFFHSACGDKFNWTPPHDDAVNMGLAERR